MKTLELSLIRNLIREAIFLEIREQPAKFLLGILIQGYRLTESEWTLDDRLFPLRLSVGSEGLLLRALCRDDLKFLGRLLILQIINSVFGDPLFGISE